MRKSCGSRSDFGDDGIVTSLYIWVWDSSYSCLPSIVCYASFLLVLLASINLPGSGGFVTFLYIVSYFVRSAIRSGETQIFGGIPGFDRVTSLG